MVRITQEQARGYLKPLEEEAKRRYGVSIKGAKLIERGIPKRGIHKYTGAYKEIIAKGFLPGKKGKRAPPHMMPRTLGAATGIGAGKPCMGATILITAMSVLLTVLLI